MSHKLDPREVEHWLGRLPLERAPDSLWGRIEAELRRPQSPGTAMPLTRRQVRPWLAAAAVIAALLGGAFAGVLRSFDARSPWAVVPLSGSPTVAGSALAQAGDLAAGEWLVTDAVSRAELAVGRIGSAAVGPNSRVRRDKGGLTQHRLTLERGALQAVITAPPRLFFVETPSALATDLGCAYTLEVDSTGASRLRVTAGWVELKQGDAISLVPAGLAAEVQPGGRPGTPYPAGFPAEAQQALRRLDAGRGGRAELDLVFGALHTPSEPLTLRQQSAITLWHLLQRVDPPLREPVYQRLAALSAPPDRVSREGILALQRPMLERWRRDLNPMWSEEALPLWTRLARRLWEWAIR